MDEEPDSLADDLSQLFHPLDRVLRPTAERQHLAAKQRRAAEADDITETKTPVMSDESKTNPPVLTQSIGVGNSSVWAVKTKWQP